MPKGLAEFAATAKNDARRCAICTLDPKLLAELREGRLSKKDRPSFKTMSDWLASEKKIRISPENLQRHWAYHEPR